MSIWEVNPIDGADPNVGVGSRHHILPRFYLERFADGAGMVDQYDRDDGSKRRLHVRNVLVERDFYTIVNTDGVADGRVEQLLAAVEGNAAQALRNLFHPAFGQWPPPIDYREALVHLVAFQLLRGRSHRRAIELMADFEFRLFWSQVDSANAASVLRDRGEDDSPESVEGLLEALQDLDDLEIAPSTNDHIGIMLESFPQIAHVLRQRPLYLAEWDQPCIITCDEPVLLCPHPDQPPGLGTGVLTAAEIWFPLDPRRLLIFGGYRALGSDGRETPDAEDAELLSELLKHNSYEFYFCPPHVEPASIGVAPGPRAVMNLTFGGDSVDVARYAGIDVRRRPLARFRVPSG